MTFDLLERSRWSGRPQGFLRLARGSLVERYTTADRDLTVGDDLYTALAISRSAIIDSGQESKGVLTLTLPIDAPVTAWWRPYPPSTPVSVTWLAKHSGDTGVAVEWMGRVIGQKFDDKTLTLYCEQTRTRGRRRGLVLRWQRGCPLALYSLGLGMCNVIKADFAVPGTLDTFNVTSLESAAFAAVPDGRLRGGMIEWTRDDGEPEVRTIMAHSGELVLLNYGTDTLEVGSSVIAYPGCAHNYEDCDGFFGNGPNFGGGRFMPRRAPFDGNPR